MKRILIGITVIAATALLFSLALASPGGLQGRTDGWKSSSWNHGPGMGRMMVRFGSGTGNGPGSGVCDGSGPGYGDGTGPAPGDGSGFGPGPGNGPGPGFDPDSESGPGSGNGSGYGPGDGICPGPGLRS